MLAASSPQPSERLFAFTFSKLHNICSILALSRVHESSDHSLSRFPRQSSISSCFCFVFSVPLFLFSFEHRIRTRVTRTLAQREENVHCEGCRSSHFHVVDEKSDDDGEKFTRLDVSALP